jgi:single-strand DNA-binding protein
MAGLNKIIVIGRLGRDPEMRYTPSGKPVTNFSVATSRSYTTSEGERREETEWFDVDAWIPRLAEVCNQYLTKGKLVYVEGRLRSSTYETQDGEKRFKNSINLSEVQFLDPMSRPVDPETSDGSTGDPPPTPPTDNAEDLPF